MTPYLIAHKVRGAAAFDVAEQMRCPICGGVGSHANPDFETGEMPDYEGASCTECDGTGYWWIVSTSGHRAYPYWECRLDDVLVECAGEYESITFGVPEMPAEGPDHYPINKAPEERVNPQALLTRLGLGREPIRRRL